MKRVRPTTMLGTVTIGVGVGWIVMVGLWPTVQMTLREEYTLRWWLMICGLNLLLGAAGIVMVYLGCTVLRDRSKRSTPFSWNSSQLVNRLCCLFRCLCRCLLQFPFTRSRNGFTKVLARMTPLLAAPRQRRGIVQVGRKYLERHRLTDRHMSHAPRVKKEG